MDLVRRAMREYLRSRTPADKLPIPAALSHLTDRDCTVAVTLRRGPEELARSIRSGAGLCRNTIAAALKAMRAPALGDRVTVELLAGLTVEVEVLGEMRDVPESSLVGSIVPGLWGLRLRRGRHEAYVLPSEAVMRGLDPQAVFRKCVARLPLTRANSSLPRRASVYGTRHFVGLPGMRAVWLYRGKILYPPEVVDEYILSVAARQVAAHLARTQGPEGRYRSIIVPAPLRTHLRATWAMSRLARSVSRRLISASVDKALDCAVRAVKGDKTTAHVGTKNADDQLAATALLVLTGKGVRMDTETRELHRRLVAGLTAALTEDNRFRKRLDGTSKAPARGRDAYLAYLALRQVLWSDKSVRPRLAAVRKALAEAPVRSAAESLWAAYVGVYPDKIVRPVRGNSIARDEQGGFAEPGEPPTVTLTSLMIQAGGRLKTGHEPASSYALAGKRFCYQMMYKPREAYFLRQPQALVGGVRESPVSSRITVEACAAAIEAFLAEAD